LTRSDRLVVYDLLANDDLKPKKLFIHVHHYADWTSMAWHWSGNRIATGSNDSHVRIWDFTEESTVKRATRILKGHRGFITDIVSHPSKNLLASSSSDGTIRVWSWSTNICINKLSGHKGLVTSLAASENYLVSGSDDQTVCIWSWHSESPSYILGRYLYSIVSLAWKHNMLAVVETNGTVCIFRDTSSDNPLHWPRYRSEYPKRTVMGYLRETKIGFNYEDDIVFNTFEEDHTVNTIVKLSFV